MEFSGLGYLSTTYNSSGLSPHTTWPQWHCLWLQNLGGGGKTIGSSRFVKGSSRLDKVSGSQLVGLDTFGG